MPEKTIIRRVVRQKASGLFLSLEGGLTRDPGKARQFQSFLLDPALLDRFGELEFLVQCSHPPDEWVFPPVFRRF